MNKTYSKTLSYTIHLESPENKATKLRENAGITSKNGRNDAKRLNINVVTVTNDDKMKKRKTQ